tara:strand:- start:4 stop:375 length:372 start_codon:yes stop_codon:yes gene_type:complete
LSGAYKSKFLAVERLEMLKPRRLLALLTVMLCAQVAQAERLRVTDVTMADSGEVQFDITWNASWRASWEESGTRYANWDAAWVFVKYREKGAASWSHASLSSKDSAREGRGLTRVGGRNWSNE